jgi:hypothetical protein
MKEIFQNKRNINILLVISFLLALTFRFREEIAYPDLDSDYYIQAMQTEDFMEGHGFTSRYIRLNDISDVKYIMHGTWPVGLPIILLPLCHITNLVNAIVIVQLLSVMLLLFSLLRIFKILELNKLTLFLFLLFTSFNLSYSYSFITDKLAAAIFLFAMGFALEAGTGKSMSVIKEVGVGVLLFCTMSLRYAYIANIVIIPVFFAFTGIAKHQWKLIYTGLKIFVFAAIPAFIFFNAFKINQQHTGFISQLAHLNFNWSSLKQCSPFPSRTFFDPFPIYRHMPLTSSFKFYLLVEYIISGLVLGLLFWYFFLKRNWWERAKTNDPIASFTTLSCLAFLVIGSFLVFNTLTTIEGNTLYETRYFIVLTLIIQVLFFTLIDQVIKKNVTIKALPVFVWSLFVISTVYSIVISESVSANVWHDTNVNERDHYWNGLEYKWYNTLNADAQKNKGISIIITGYDRKYIDSPPGYSNGVCAIEQYDSLIDGNFHHSKPVIIYALIPASLNAREKNFISIYGAKQVLKSDQGEVYRAFLH